LSLVVRAREWWQKGQNRGSNDWFGIKKIRDTFPQIVLIGNGDVMRKQDFKIFQELSGVDAVMSGYGALLDPSIFYEAEVPLSDRILSYLTIAQQHYNEWVGVLRHIAWMIKRHVHDPNFKQKLFLLQSMSELLEFLVGIEIIDSNSCLIDLLNADNGLGILYPKTFEVMSQKEKKKYLKRFDEHLSSTRKSKFNISSSSTENEFDFSLATFFEQ